VADAKVDLGTQDEDAFMPDPDELTVAPKVPEPLKGPVPTGADEPTEPEDEDPKPKEGETLPDKDGGEGKDAAAKDAADDPDAKDDEGDDDWDKDRQAKDEEEARRGQSKAALRAENERLKAELGAAKSGKATGTDAKGKTDAKPDSGKAPEIADWEDLPETDDYNNTEIPGNKILNQLGREKVAMQRQVQELLDRDNAREAQRENEDNHQAYRSLLKTATKDAPTDRNEVNKRVKAEWKERGYTPEFYPDADQTLDIVKRIATEVRAERLQKDLEAARKGGKRPTATDTGKGGAPRIAVNPHRLEMDYDKALKQQRKAGLITY